MTDKNEWFWKLKPLADYIFVSEYGQPNQSVGGIHLVDGDRDFGRYRMSELRLGEVIAVGPGRWHHERLVRLPVRDVVVGDKVLFSRKHGTRLPGRRYLHPDLCKQGDAGLVVRVLDPGKVVAVVSDFHPWWDVQAAQGSPGGVMTG